MLIYSLFRSAREGPADKQACTLFCQQKGGGAGWENLVNPSPEPGLYKGTYPSVLRVPFGRESRRQARGKSRRSRPAASSSSSPPSPSSTPRRRRPQRRPRPSVICEVPESATSPTPSRGRQASQGSRGRSHGASVRLRKCRRLTFYPLPILLQICMHTHVHWCSPGRHPSMSPKKCCTST